MSNEIPNNMSNDMPNDIKDKTNNNFILNKNIENTSLFNNDIIEDVNNNFKEIFGDLGYLTNEIKNIKLLLSNSNNYQPIKKIKNLQLEINKTESNYTFNFSKLDNVLGIKLVSYSLPHPRFNILDSEFIYYIGSNNQLEKKIINIEKGFYTIRNLLDILNKNNDIHFNLNIKQKIDITPYIPEFSDSTSLILKKNFKIESNIFTKKIGFLKENYELTNKISSDLLCDLRLPTKIYMFITNLQQDMPFSILNFNSSSSANLEFKNPISLDKLDILFIGNNNEEYDFDDIDYNLSFSISILDVENSDNKIYL